MAVAPRTVRENWGVTPPLKLLILSFSPIAQDARVLKQLGHFSSDYEVTTCGHGPSPDGVARHIEIPADLQVWRYSRRLLVSRQFTRAYRSNAAIAFAAGHLAAREFDIVLANDVDAVPLALDLAPRLGVHADLHEYAPRQKEELLRWRIFVAPFMRWICRRHVTRAASVTTVSDGLAREYLREFGIRAETVVNAAPYEALEPVATGSTIRLVHSGACFSNRHLMTMIDAVALTTRPVTLDLFLTPNDPVYLEELKARAGRTTGVTVHNPVPYRSLASTLHEFDVGVFVLPPVNFNYRWALPNKLFDFIQARLAVVIGPSEEMTRYVRDYGLGLVADDFSIEALAAAIDALTPKTVDGMKRNADAAAGPLSAESQIEIWDAAIRRLAAR